MVAPTWDLMSSPMIGTPASVNFCAHVGVAGDEHRQRVDERDPGVDRALGVEAVGVLGAHRQVGDQHVGLGVLEDLDDVHRALVGLLDHLAVVLAEAVEGVAALDGDAERRHVADLDRVVLAGHDRLGQVAADLLGVDVERGDELDVADVVLAELDVHQAGHPRAGVGVLVVVHALDERAWRSCRHRRWQRARNPCMVAPFCSSSGSVVFRGDLRLAVPCPGRGRPGCSSCAGCGSSPAGTLGARCRSAR